jgi:hypothetical protein
MSMRTTSEVIDLAIRENWYQDVVLQGDMADPAEIAKGYMVRIPASSRVNFSLTPAVTKTPGHVNQENQALEAGAVNPDGFPEICLIESS